MAPTVVFPLPDTPATIRIISHANLVRSHRWRSARPELDEKFRLNNDLHAAHETPSLVALAPPAGGVIKDYTAHGHLTLHGTTREVTFTLTAERKGSQIEVVGGIPVLFADYNIQNPSFTGFVTTQDHGLLEFLLVFNRT
ncbi:MAG TPA: YceI family protein [Streptosporangiaceae bacterium]|nr:YceI family protein [Streptosporangiaceae bacterium]